MTGIPSFEKKPYFFQGIAVSAGFKDLEGLNPKPTCHLEVTGPLGTAASRSWTTADVSCQSSGKSTYACSVAEDLSSYRTGGDFTFKLVYNNLKVDPLTYGHYNISLQPYNPTLEKVTIPKLLDYTNFTIQAELRYETKPGEMMQCDWLEYPYETTDGSKKKVYGLSMVLGYSRMRYVEFFSHQGLLALLKGHLGAFEYFGGVTKMILYDNLRSVVLNRKYPSTASEFHPLFADFRDHFGFTSRLCRIGRAKTKGKVERAIYYVKDNFLYGRTFHSIEDLNLQARTWLNCVNGKVHGTTHEIPFDRLVQENLRPFAL
ncbi:MAG: IS21 family transposase, partial [Spirochaetia bacterium]|nr:IS21 family transposase [Spirochaetia bacterium]